MANYINNKFHTNIFQLSLLLLLFPLVANTYDPVYNLAINCGSSINSTSLDNRIWISDNIDNTKLFSFIEPKTTNSSIKSQPNNLYLPIPFKTARISLSNFTYSFSNITNSPVFLRLHFYPTSYQNFEPSNSLFSVKVNNFTLLKDINPSLWLQNDDKTITKEYCIQIKPSERVLNITFIPNNINQTNVYYAFINGIEIVSMPSYLYYTDPNDSNYHFKLLDFDNNEYQIANNKALEIVYRVNVGENQVPPNDDTGMFRNWDNDFPLYLEKQYPASVSSVFNTKIHLNYLNNTIPNYTAPEGVYLTARSYGEYETEDYNVTWNFEVDSAFTYMVRLHFCEFSPEIKNPYDRVFKIFIADTLAEPMADVIEWSGGNMVPVHKDYAVTMYSQKGLSSENERANLSIKLQRLPKGSITKYRDVTMNGIEIIKISDINNNLAGSISKSKVVSQPQQVLKIQSSKKVKITMVVAVAVAISCLVLTIILGITVFWLRRRLHKLSKSMNAGSQFFPTQLCRYFTIEEIRAATNNFDDNFIIGVGGFGNVYKGYIDKSTPVAIKRLKSGSQQGKNEFINEIKLLSQLRHIHLVSLIGYCNENTEMILVYEFMHHGTLCEYLYGTNNQPLQWKKRLEILLGAARGLHYLHAEVKQKIIHRDVKTTNILLDEKWVAKVADFGLSKVGPTGISTTHVSTMVKGSLGYLDPEYYMLQRLTLKSDVYSFGVVLLEVLCARPPLIRDLDKKTASLVCWFQNCYDEGVAIEQIIDPFLKESIPSECLKCYCKLALNCLQDDGNQRPSMSQVVEILEFMLQLEVSEEDSQFCMNQKEGTNKKFPQFFQFMSDEGSESDLLFTRSRTFKERTVSAIPSTQEEPFFEIENTKARSYSCENFKVYI